MRHTFLAGAVLLGLCAGATAQDEPRPGPAPTAADETLPMPADGWWEQLSGGETATYQVDETGISARIRVVVDERTASLITITTHTDVAGLPQAVPPQTQVLDASQQQAMREQTVPPGTTVSRVGEEQIEAAGRQWACTVYEIAGEQEGVKVKARLWHSPELLPVFNNGGVKMTIDVDQAGCEPRHLSFLLVEYEPGAAGAKPSGAATKDGAVAPEGSAGEER